MTAKCMTCDTLRNWRATRGAKLSEARCSCGGELEAASYHKVPEGGDSYGYAYVGRKTGRVGHWKAGDGMSTLDGSPKTLEQLFAELKDAGDALEKAVDALNVYNGITKKIDAQLRKLRESSPPRTDWSDASAVKGGTA
jgi:hypothetical protein